MLEPACPLGVLWNLSLSEERWLPRSGYHVLGILSTNHVERIMGHTWNSKSFPLRYGDFQMLGCSFPDSSILVHPSF